ncbi:hypothetical protein FNF29_05277 [Cafeteria roenbergensis]|uniref:Purple acid phosphatase n=1 Tax=Cafeteria roenbergensis TaxID=33653 RepID=A0A5A8CD32_CAFRO|nr:hypothetical protein FNF29_05277 [Cafeteria roenbergensis]|eukprot:KAA0150474.1 hypothetical protein FNF29_05277 [Cafeteria roenbergensis]
MPSVSCALAAAAALLLANPVAGGVMPPPRDVARYKWLVNAGSNASEPQQVHASFGEDPMTSLQFVWSTRTAADTILRFGEAGKPMTSIANGTSTPFDEPVQFIHRAAATGLRAGTTYSYVVGSPAGGWSNVSTMTTAPVPGSPEAGALVFAVYGDMGLDNERSLAWLVKDVEAGAFDAVLHVGDLGYDLDSDGGLRGDAFMNSIAPITARVPYHTMPGNHEIEGGTFKAYRSRFWMPASNDALYHSIDVGNAHFSMISSEMYFAISEYGLLMMPEQFTWLEKDLAAVDRTKSPWLVLMLHRPMYCQDDDSQGDACHTLTNPTRVGYFGQYALEPLLLKYGVDLVVGAHEHFLGLSKVLYNNNASTAVMSNQTDGSILFRNPGAPVHILAGSAGCPEKLDVLSPTQPEWSAGAWDVYGYGYLSFPSASRATWSFRNDTDGSIINRLEFQQDHHGPFAA